MILQPPVSSKIKERRWRYVGHVFRRDNQRITKQAVQWETTEKRIRGRPRETLKRTLIRETELAGFESLKEIEKLTQDKDSWREILQALCDA
jgi:hypothetical protein